MLNKIGSIVKEIVIEVIITVTSLAILFGAIQAVSHVTNLKKENEMLREELFQIERVLEELLIIED